MADKIEMSLDDIIKASRQRKGVRKTGAVGQQQQRGFRPNRNGAAASPRKATASGGILKGRRGGAVTKTKGERGNVNAAWTHDLYDGPKSLATIGNGATKLIVGNLHFGVSNKDIKELFSEFGPLKKAEVHYDRSGRSLGTAEVIFERRVDALKAIKQYNTVPLDGRPMDIKLATDIQTVAKNSGTANLNRRPGQFRRPAGPNLRRPGKPVNGNTKIGGGRLPPTQTGPRGRSRAVPPTAEELDAELDAYVNDMKI